MEMSRADRLVDLLKEAGWPKREAECYCTLVRFGPNKASRIASEIDMRQAKVYEPLNRLEEKGYVKIRDENPKVYMAQNPRHVIGIENEKMRQRSKEILTGLEEAWEVQEEVSGEGDVAEVVRGRDSKDMELLNILNEAEETLLGADLRRIRFGREAREKMKERAGDIEIRLVGDPRFSDLLESFQESGAEVRVTSEDARFSYYVADGERVLLSIHNERTTIVFEEEHIASIFMENFEDLFERAGGLEEYE